MPQIVGESVQRRTLEQFVEVLVPQIVEERVPNRTPEQIVDVPVPLEECAQNRAPDQIMDVPVPPVLEAVVEVSASTRVRAKS